MSAHNPPVEISPEAQDDLASIALYSADRWGPQQRDAYVARLVAAMYELSRFPGRGRLRTDLGDGIRAYPIAQHVIYYWVNDETISIVRILHARMDAASQLTE